MEKIQQVLDSYSAKGEDTKDKILGASFIVLDKDGLLFQGSTGRRDLAQDSASFDADTFVELASMTKLLTAISVLQVVEQGLIGLEDDVRPHIRQLAEAQILRGFDENDKPILEDNTKPITLIDMLVHRSGLPYDIAEADILKWRKYVGKETINTTWSLEGFTTPLKFAPGEGWAYGTGTDWAGQVVEKLTGTTLNAFMKENLFEPLGMDSSTFWPKELPHVADRTGGFMIRTPEGALVSGPSPFPKEHDLESGGAGGYSTANNYAKAILAILQGGLLSKQSLDILAKPQLNELQQKAITEAASTFWNGYCPEFPTDTKLSYAVGGMVNLTDVPGKRRAGSIMWSGYFNSHWWIDPQTGIGAVLITSIFPPADAVIIKLYDELERAVYEGLPALKEQRT